MKRAFSVVMVCALVLGVQAQSWAKKDKAPEKSKGFIEDFAAAKKEAAAFKQPIFAFFTGSDWCGWCMKLRSEALDTKAFEKFAADNLILLEVDFPQNKKQSAALKKQNEELAAQYKVSGYPDVFLLDAEGKELGRTGYQTGGAEAYVAHLKELLGKAGITAVDKPAAGKAQSAYEKMKAGKADPAAGGAAKNE
jgi:thioredoxin-related protein